MFRNWFRTAWGDLRRSPVQSLIAIGGLAIGLTAAILAILLVANQANYDSFFPGHDRLYVVTVEASLGGFAPQFIPDTPHDLAARLKTSFSEIEAIARLKIGTHSLRQNKVEAEETIYAADPNIFSLLKLPVLYGDLDKALIASDRIVVPRGIARKYFGRDNVVGETLELDRQHLLRISAVIADLPDNATNLRTGIFISGLSAYSDLSQADRKPANARNGDFSLDVQTLLRLRRGASVTALQRQMLAKSDSLLPRLPTISATLGIMQLNALHLSPNFSPGVAENLEIFGAVSLLILFLASVNFINLSTARAARRGIEVGVRKAAGATRSLLVAQFLAESVLQALFALLIAFAVVEWALPEMNAFLAAGAAFDYWHDPALVALALLGTALVGLLAGFYPALVLSAFRPAAVLKGLKAASPNAGVLRTLLVTLQFAILVALMIAAGTILEQHRFTIRESLRFNADQILFVSLPEVGTPQLDRVSLCTGAFSNAVAVLPGVRGIGCSDKGLLQDNNSWLVLNPDGRTTALRMVGAGPGLLELYGQRPVAGRALRDTDKVGDSLSAVLKRTRPINLVVNETAVRKLGFVSPQAAVGHVLRLQGVPFPAIIVGVLKDFSISAPEQNIEATAYDYFMQNFLIHMKLKGGDIPETLAAIDATWNRTEPTGPIQKTFMNTYIENLHLSLLREGQALLVFTAIAVLLGCLGLFGLSLSATARRIKEIGVRKAMGATNVQVIGLLLWQFAEPVLWANVIAWPLAWWAMNRWLAGFAYHVSLPLWLFPAAGAVTLLIALLTVVGQAILTARQRPVLALRYE